MKAMVFNAYANPSAKRGLEEEARKPHGPALHLVQLGLAEEIAGTDGKRVVRLKQTA